MSVRTYLTFGSDDKRDWRLLQPVTASGPDQARNLVQANDGGWEHYAVVPARNWSAGTPTTKTVVSWDDLQLPGQLTVDDVIEEDGGGGKEQIDALVAKAKDALHDEAEPAKDAVAGE